MSFVEPNPSVITRASKPAKIIGMFRTNLFPF